MVQIEAVNDTSDVNQLGRQIDQANQNLEEPCKVGCADAGYADTEELKKIDKQGIEVVVPSQRQALHNQEDKPFGRVISGTTREGLLCLSGGQRAGVCGERSQEREKGLSHQHGGDLSEL